MTLLSLIFVALTSLTTSSDAAGRLDTIKARFSARPLTQTKAELTELQRKWPDSEAAAQARVWLGSLALSDKDDAQRLKHADAWFIDAAQHPRTKEVDTLLERGKGDVAYARRQWREAATHYAAALAESSGLVGVELTAKRAAALREVRRAHIELGCWLFVALAVSWLLRELRRAEQARWPREATFLAPVYALIVLVAWSRDSRVAQAIATFAMGSLVMVTLTFASATSRRLGRNVVVALLATLALLFIALRRAELLDLTWETLRGPARLSAPLTPPTLTTTAPFGRRA